MKTLFFFMILCLELQLFSTNLQIEYNRFKSSPDKGIKIFEKHYKKSPDDHWVKFYYASLLLLNNNLLKALPLILELRKLETIDKDLFENARIISENYCLQLKDKEKESSLKSLLKIFPENELILLEYEKFQLSSNKGKNLTKLAELLNSSNPAIQKNTRITIQNMVITKWNNQIEKNNFKENLTFFEEAQNYIHSEFPIIYYYFGYTLYQVEINQGKGISLNKIQAVMEKLIQSEGYKKITEKERENIDNFFQKIQPVEKVFQMKSILEPFEIVKNNSYFKITLRLPPDTDHQKLISWKIQPEPKSFKLQNVMGNQKEDFLFRALTLYYPNGGPAKLEVLTKIYKKSTDYRNQLHLMKEKSSLYPEFLLSSFNLTFPIEPESSLIQNIVNTQINQSSSFLDQIISINEYIKKTLTYDKKIKNKTLQDIIQTGKDKCTGYSELFIAIARNLKIPSRAVSGISVDKDFLKTPKKDRIGHQKPEFFIPEIGWVVNDVTWGDEYFGYESPEFICCAIYPPFGILPGLPLDPAKTSFRYKKISKCPTIIDYPSENIHYKSYFEERILLDECITKYNSLLNQGQDNFEKGYSFFKSAYEKYPENPDFIYYVIASFPKTTHPQVKFQLIEKALELSASDQGLLNNIGILRKNTEIILTNQCIHVYNQILKNKDFQNGKSIFNKILTFFSDENIQYFYSYCLLMTGDKKAITQLESLKISNELQESLREGIPDVLNYARKIKYEDISTTPQDLSVYEKNLPWWNSKDKWDFIISAPLNKPKKKEVPSIPVKQTNSSSNSPIKTEPTPETKPLSEKKKRFSPMLLTGSGILVLIFLFILFFTKKSEKIRPANREDSFSFSSDSWETSSSFENNDNFSSSDSVSSENWEDEWN